LLKSQGYTVKVTRAAGDYGADLVMEKPGKKIVVQAKRHSKSVGIEAVQQVQLLWGLRSMGVIQS